MRGFPVGRRSWLPWLVAAAIAGLLVSRLAGDGAGPADAPPRAEAPTGEPEAEPTPSPDGSLTKGGPVAERPPGLYLVTRVVDGDTIHVARGGDETVRLIGIDTPEVPWYGGEGECFGEEAARFLRRLLDGERVALELDEDPIDPYERTLAYVFLEDGRMVNVLLLRRGFAIVTIFEPNDRYEDRLRAAEAAARAGGRGLWSAC